MSLDIATLLLAFVAGVLSIVSPCVWPLVPIVMGSAARAGLAGQIALALGLSFAFALAGSALSFVLVSLGLDPELFRFVAAGMLVLVALPLLSTRIGSSLTLLLSRLSSRFDSHRQDSAGTWQAQFGVGMLLGIVWLPCVGPTLGAAIALASMGQQLWQAFAVMFVFGLGTASVLLAAGLLSARVLQRWKPQLLAGGGQGKLWLGVSLLLLGLLVLSGADKTLERLAIGWLPEWAVSL